MKYNIDHIITSLDDVKSIIVNVDKNFKNDEEWISFHVAMLEQISEIINSFKKELLKSIVSHKIKN